MISPIRTRLVVSKPLEAPVGGISLAGFIRHSRGLRKPRILGSYAVVYLIEGEGHYRDASHQVSLREGDLLVIFPDIAHTYGPGPGQRWSEFYIVFHGPVFDLWREKGLLDPARPVIHLEAIDYWTRRLTSSVDGASAVPSAAQALTAVCRLQQVLGEALAGASGTLEASDREWLTRATALLEGDSARTAPPLEEVAGMLGMSYALFRKRFAALAGVPPAKYRMRRLIDRACQLIHQRDLSIKEVADACGFADEFHFSRRFRQVMGMPPREFRKRLP
jgi:AraC-like DNA-binding protein